MTRFPTELERRLPQFHRCGRERGAGDSPMWAWELAPKLTYFIKLQPFEDKDQFVIEVAWSDEGTFPWRDLAPHPPNPELPKSRGRLARLWATGKTEDVWAVVPDEPDEVFWQRLAARRRGEKVSLLGPKPPPVEEALPRVAPLAEDAVQKLIDYGLPLFRRVAEQRGINWPLPGDQAARGTAAGEASAGSS